MVNLKGCCLQMILWGDTESGEQLLRIIDVVHAYCRKWRLKANVSKNAVQWNLHYPDSLVPLHIS